jgi:hypothetical protein
LTTFGFSRGQTKTRSTIARTIAAGMITGCDEKKWPISSEGEPFETVCGRSSAATITITMLITVKKSAWTTKAEPMPATDDPAMLVRKMPIIAAVPPCAGTSALIAVPPWEAPHAVRKEIGERGYAARRMFRQPSPMKADSAVFSASASSSQ